MGWIIIHRLFDHQPPTGFFFSTLEVFVFQPWPVLLLDCPSEKALDVRRFFPTVQKILEWTFLSSAELRASWGCKTVFWSAEAMLSSC